MKRIETLIFQKSKYKFTYLEENKEKYDRKIRVLMTYDV